MAEPAEAGGGGGSTWTDSAAGRLVGALVAPGATFRSLARRPTWVLALVVFTLAFLGQQLAVTANSDPEASRQAMIEQLEARGQVVDDEQLEQIEKWQRYGLGCVLILVPLVCLVNGLLLWALSNLVGGETTFHRVMAVVTHGTMPLVVASLLTVVVAYAGGGGLDPAEVQRSGGLLSSNLAFLAPEDASLALVVALTFVDLFQLWALALTVWGMTLAAGISLGAAGGIVGLVWVLEVAALAGLASLGGGGG
jgi:hypothetical protein